MFVCSTKSNAIESPLLRLAPELRNRICEYVLGGNNVHIEKFYTIGSRVGTLRHVICRRPNGNMESYERCSLDWIDDANHHACPKTGSDDVLSMTLLGVSRQLHRECALLPYSLNTFVFDFEDHLRDFVAGLMPAQLRSIRSVQFRDMSVYWLRRPTKLSILTNLSTISLFGYCPEARYRDFIKIKDEHALERLRELPLKRAAVHLTMLESVPNNNAHLDPNEPATLFMVRDVEEWAKRVELRLLKKSGEGNGPS